MRKSVIAQLQSIPLQDVFKKYHVEFEEGRNFRCPFPAHGATGNTPSARFYPDTNSMSCFGCHKGGGPIQFVMNMEGCAFVPACDKLMEMYGMEKLPEFSFQTLIDRNKLKEQEQEVYLKFCNLAEFLNLIDPMDADSVKKFSLLYLLLHDVDSVKLMNLAMGFLSRSFKDCFDLILDPEVKARVENDQRAGIRLIKGLIRHQFEQDRAFDPNLTLSGYFSESSGFQWKEQNNRYLFPIFLPGKLIVGYSGRALMGEFVKYQTELLSNLKKHEVVYGLDVALPAIKQAGYVIVVEGILDAIRCRQVGFNNVVAPCCAYLSKNILAILKVLTNRFILLQDNDYGGNQEAEMSIKNLKASGCEYVRMLVPEGEDPDSFGKVNPQGLADLLKPVWI